MQNHSTLLNNAWTSKMSIYELAFCFVVALTHPVEIGTRMNVSMCSKHPRVERRIEASTEKHANNQKERPNKKNVAKKRIPMLTVSI